jgi:hypothetical protein
MGTVILFDILFSSRWDSSQTNTYDGAEQIRNLFFGLPPHVHEGIQLCSISTMGSPISIYSLLMAHRQNLPTTHDITDQLEEMLQTLHNTIGRPLPWCNFIHPADIIAYPLAELLPGMVDPQKKYLAVKDILTSVEYTSERDSSVLSDGGNLFSHLLGSMVHMLPVTDRNNAPYAIKKAGELAEKMQMALTCGPAHGSYWTSQKVAHEIATTIKTVAQQVRLPLAANRQ